MRAERKEDVWRDKWRENGAFCLIMFEREDGEPGAVLQEEVKHFHESVLTGFTCSCGRLKPRHA